MTEKGYEGNLSKTIIYNDETNLLCFSYVKEMDNDHYSPKLFEYKGL